MLSPYRIQPNNTNKRTKKFSNNTFDNNSHHEHDFKRPQLTSNDLTRSNTNKKFDKRNKNILNGGSMHENIEINDEFLDKNFHKNDS